MHRDYLYWIWLSLAFGTGGGFTEVLEKFGEPYAAYIADEGELRDQLGADSPAIPRLLSKDLRRAHEIYDFCASRGVSILTYGDIAYPARLRTIQSPPVLLYYVGTLPAFNRKLCIGVVGTRRMSEYGKRMAYKISYELAAAGAVVVSGMALGCDAVAAGGAITAGGETVAILGSGIDVVYPRQHLKLMECIKEHGVVMTEYPPGSPPSAHHFPQRNRIISGLCQGTLAVEGDLRSGALLTVGHAVKQGRKVFAVPGNVGESSAAGTNELIRNGAGVVLDGGDILDAFEVTHKEVIDLARYQSARLRSALDEGALLRMGITSRIAERTPEGAERLDTEEPGIPLPEKKRTPADVVSPRRRRNAEEREAPADPPKPRAGRGTADAEKQTAPAPKKKPAASAGDDSAAVVASLSERDRAIFEEMPLDQAISLDRLGGLGYSIGDIMAGLTILEIQGLVTSLPGGLYLKK